MYKRVLTNSRCDSFTLMKSKLCDRAKHERSFHSLFYLSLSSFSLRIIMSLSCYSHTHIRLKRINDWYKKELLSSYPGGFHVKVRFSEISHQSRDSQPKQLRFTIKCGRWQSKWYKNRIVRVCIDACKCYAMLLSIYFTCTLLMHNGADCILTSQWKKMILMTLYYIYAFLITVN